MEMDRIQRLEHQLEQLIRLVANLHLRLQQQEQATTQTTHQIEKVHPIPRHPIP